VRLGRVSDLQGGEVVERMIMKKFGSKSTPCTMQLTIQSTMSLFGLSQLVTKLDGEK
jgi:hypothetical protein